MSGRFLDVVKVAGGCGVAADGSPDSVSMASGRSNARLLTRKSGDDPVDTRWNNHAVVVTL